MRVMRGNDNVWLLQDPGHPGVRALKNGLLNKRGGCGGGAGFAVPLQSRAKAVVWPSLGTLCMLRSRQCCDACIPFALMLCLCTSLNRLSIHDLSCSSIELLASFHDSSKHPCFELLSSQGAIHVSIVAGAAPEPSHTHTSATTHGNWLAYLRLTAQSFSSAAVLNPL